MDSAAVEYSIPHLGLRSHLLKRSPAVAPMPVGTTGSLPDTRERTCWWKSCRRTHQVISTDLRFLVRRGEGGQFTIL